MTYNPRNFEPLKFAEALPAFLSGKDTPRDYLERCLDTIAKREQEVRAFVVINEPGARKAADASSERYRAGRPLSRVDGMPIGIKDLYETEDMPTQFGSPLFRNHNTHRDAAAVFGLRRSGAVILGKTVTTEFGFYSPGPTRNPFDLKRTPGGSSSGSAAAVGARMIPAAIGSQVVGSLIRPAGYCANIGYKPTFGALNRGGGGTGLSQACIGVHAGSIDDTWIVAHEIARTVGGDPGHPGLEGDATPPPAERPARLIRVDTAGWKACDPTTRARFEAALEHLAACGIEIVAKEDQGAVSEFEDLIKEAREITHDVCGYELRWPLKAYRERGPNALSEDIAKRLEVWERLTPVDYRKALSRREELRRKHQALRELAPAFITLSSAGAPPIGMATGDPVFAIPASLLAAPALSLPVLEVDGMPLGLQIFGYPHADAQLGGIGRWILQAFNFR
jgi:Asp-tRNA(Asn)/Glu-tRNA(Gln) amidotransferase A subunit family amidase